MKIERLEHILIKPVPPVEKREKIWEDPQRQKTEKDIAQHHKKERKKEIEKKKEEGIDITV